MNIEKARVYGVDRVGQSNPDLRIYRTNDAAGLKYTIGASEIHSDLSKCYPYSDMKRIVDSKGNVFTRIPKFYAGIMQNEDGTLHPLISGIRYEGFTTLFEDGKGNELDFNLVGSYEGSLEDGKIWSKSGKNVATNMTIDAYRTACMAHGKGYQQYDFMIDWILKILFTVEFATTHSQGIMRGFVDSSNTAAVQTGRTDSVATPSGSETSNTDGFSACKYRGIENPWGNTWTFCDGVSFNAEKVYICADPTAYESGKTASPYTLMGVRPMANGYAKTITPFAKNPLLMFTSDATGSASSYYCDYQAAGGQILLVSGHWNFGTYAGLWSWSASNAAGYSHSSVGGRLCYKPIDGAVGI